MRICMVSDNYYPYVGGIAEHVHFLAIELRKRGHVVKVLTARIGGRMMECMAEVPGEEHVKRIGYGLVVRTNKSFARVTVDWHPVAKIRRYFEEERFDVIHVHGSLAPTLPIAAIQASRVLNIVTFHAGHEQSLGYALFRTELMPYFDAVHGLIAVSETARLSCYKYFRGPYHIIPNGIDLTFFRPDAGRVPGLDDGRPRILFVGRFEPRKGLKHLLSAMPEIVRSVPNVELVVVGTGLLGYSYKSYLSKEVQEHVRWAGLVQNEDRPKYYASCDVYCSPATGQESFGIVLLEAMATGKPVVASDIDGYRTVMTDDREGLMVPPCDPPALAGAIVKILLDRETARRYAANGFERAQQYSWPKLAERVETYYEELARQYPVPRYGRKRH
jgi:phosphatidyl-myo-inositol alpha-mannosyltransferase